ncbi:type VI secretion system tip protein VgrG [Erwinia sp. Eh17-17]|uniref:type VI secretion system Vgr family protein n=1 Tax=Erwinia sp. Eh17-17 TaxID=3080330 RepID=UPI0032094F91
MVMTHFMQTAASAIAGTLNRYRLDIPSCTSPLDVEDFNGLEALSENYHYEIHFTSPDKDIDAASMLRKAATLTMGTGVLTRLSGKKIVHGYITDFRRLSGSADQAAYLIVIEPYLALLHKQYRTHRFFVNRSVREVVQQIMQEHGFHDWEYEFSLKQDYPKRGQINQYQESDLQFIRRILSEVGIFYWFSLQPDTQTEVIHFADSQSALTFGKKLPLSSPSGMSDSGKESVWGLNIIHNVVEAGVTSKDYNHRDAHRILRSAPADMTRGEGEDINYGQVYHYRPRHSERGDKFTPTAETANFYARLDHERFLSRQVLITGVCNDAMLGPAQELTVTDGAVATLPAVLQEPLVITRIHVTASRKSALSSSFTAVPWSETVCWRPALLPRPKVSGTMTARVTSAKKQDSYAWQDDAGLYRVMFDADEDGRAPGQESMPVRLAKPYGGYSYGMHFPLIQGTEVAIAFHEGDPDRPYIAHALHDSRHPDHVTADNNTRNVIRTAGLNKLRMEDKRGEEHIKLSTEYGGKTQLNLGHNVDSKRVLRGEGAELRTDKHLSLRGGAGVFITADRQADVDGQMLEMEEAVRQLEQALALARSMAKAAATARGTQGDVGSQQQLNASLRDLTSPGMLLHAPQGIGMVSPRSLRIASGGESVGIMSGHNTDISTGQSFTVAAGEAVSLLAGGQGMQLLAAKGRLAIQAQSDALSLSAQKDIDIQSTEGRMTISSAQELVLTCGGAYIKLSGGNIELGAPGNILLKSVNAQKMGPASINVTPKPLPTGYGGGFILTDEDGIPQPSTPYWITTAKGEVLQGVTDADGKTVEVNTLRPSAMKVEFGKTKRSADRQESQGEEK